MHNVVQYAKQKGAAIASWTFHQRANALKQVAQYLLERKEDYYRLAAATGCTRKDAWIDVEGGSAPCLPIQVWFVVNSAMKRHWLKMPGFPYPNKAALVPNIS